MPGLPLAKKVRDKRRPRKVAVFPFTNISGQPDDDWIGAGIAETVTVGLAQVGAFSVVGREAFFDVLKTDGREGARPRDLARGLGVSWIVAGGFQRLGNQLQITARIVNVETGTVRDSVKVDGRLDELFTLQDRIVADLSGGLAGIAGRAAPSMTAARRPAAGAQAELSEGKVASEPRVAFGVAPPVRTPGNAPSSRAGRSGSNGNGGAPVATVSGSITIGDCPPEFAAAPSPETPGRWPVASRCDRCEPRRRRSSMADSMTRCGETPLSRHDNPGRLVFTGVKSWCTSLPSGPRHRALTPNRSKLNDRDHMPDLTSWELEERVTKKSCGAGRHSVYKGSEPGGQNGNLSQTVLAAVTE